MFNGDCIIEIFREVADVSEIRLPQGKCVVSCLAMSVCFRPTAQFVYSCRKDEQGQDVVVNAVTEVQECLYAPVMGMIHTVGMIRGHQCWCSLFYKCNQVIVTPYRFWKYCVSGAGNGQAVRIRTSCDRFV